MNIIVYLGANEGNDPFLRKAVEDSVLKAGGEVTGVEPKFFYRK